MNSGDYALIRNEPKAFGYSKNRIFLKNPVFRKRPYLKTHADLPEPVSGTCLTSGFRACQKWHQPVRFLEGLPYYQ